MANISIGGQQQAANVASVGNVISTSLGQQPTVTTPQQSLLIVSNGEGGLKKSVTMVTKPITMTTSSSLQNAQGVQNAAGE